MTLPTADEVISRYKLIPHVEGGYYYRTYRSKIYFSPTNLTNRFQGERSLSSTILYLVPGAIKSKLHRLKSDEIWHFYLGDPFNLIEFYESGEKKQTKLGNRNLNEQVVQHLVSSDTWFGGFVEPGGSYSFSLLGCTISPGFEEQDFELAEKNDILEKFPQHRAQILEFF